MNSHGNIFKITTFGESHSGAIGVVIDGLPANFKIDMEYLKYELKRRKPGQSKLTTSRVENDEDFEILSGIFDGKSTGHPITIIVKNENHNSKDYEKIKNVFRPNHADLTYTLKYGIRDYRGGGRSSGRETLSRVIAGAIAKQYLYEKYKIVIKGYTKQIGNIIAKQIDYEYIEENPIRTGDKSVSKKMIEYIEKIKSDGNSVGGIIECCIVNVPEGVGEPVFGKLKGVLAGSMLSIGGIIGFEYGVGFDVINYTGETYNEGFIKEKGKIKTKNNLYSGILGGISTGENIVFRVAVKPTPSISKLQKTIDKDGKKVDLNIEGRHDPIIIPRVIPVVEAMCAIDILDLILLHQAKKSK